MKFLILIAVLAGQLDAKEVKKTTVKKVAPSLIRCISYSTIEDNATGEVVYQNPRILNFKKNGQLEVRSVTVSSETKLNLYMKMVDKNTMQIVEEEDYLVNSAPSDFMDLNEYYNIEHAAINFLPNGSMIKLHANCYKTKDEKNVPTAKYLKKMVSQKITKITEDKLFEL